MRRNLLASLFRSFRPANPDLRAASSIDRKRLQDFVVVILCHDRIGSVAKARASPQARPACRPSTRRSASSAASRSKDAPLPGPGSSRRAREEMTWETKTRIPPVEPSGWPRPGRSRRIGKNPGSPWTTAAAAQLSRYGDHHGHRTGRHRRPAEAGRGGRHAGRDGALRPLPQAVAADDPAPARPPAARASRPVGRDPGRVHRRDRAAPDVPRPPRDAVLPLAPPGRGPEAHAGPPAAPRRRDARRRTRSLALQGGAPAGELVVAGRAPARPVHEREPGGRPGRAATATPGRAQRDGRDGPGDHRPAALRRAEQRRGGAGPRSVEDRGQQSLRPCHDTAAGRTGRRPGVPRPIRR